MSAQPLAYPRTLFDETQRLRQWWLWAIAVTVSTVPAILVLSVSVRQPQIRPHLPFMLLPATVPILLIALARLRVTVGSTELVIRLFPVRRRIPIDEIAAWEPVDYRPIREFGGWGIKWSLRDSTTAYTMHGTGGVRVTTTKGKKLLIGSQRPAELAKAIAAAKGVASPAAGTNVTAGQARDVVSVVRT